MNARMSSAAHGGIAITREEMLDFLAWLKMHDWPAERAAREYVLAMGGQERCCAYRLALWKAAANRARRLTPCKD